MEDLVAALQQQAATGGGSWEAALAKATQNAQNTASALGQSEAAQARSGSAGAMRNVANAQGAAGQQAVGQGNMLRAESQQNATGELGQLLSNINAGDVNQAQASADVASQAREANAALQQQAQGVEQGITGGIFQGAQSAMKFASDGGRVPGKAPVFGNDERNDIVPSMLSPGEGVIPRTEMRDPERAAAFARALAMKHGQHMAAGGVPDSPDAGTQLGLGLANMIPGVGSAATAAWYRGHGVGVQDPSITNGGLLETQPYLESRGQWGAQEAMLQNNAAGHGPSVVPQQLTNAQSAATAGGLSALERGRGPASGAVMGATHEQQGAGFEAGRTMQGESSKASNELAQALTKQRQTDLAMAQARQQAAWRNTEINAGLSLQNQQALRGLVSGAGQAATGIASLAGKGGGGAGGGSDGGDPMQSGDLPPSAAEQFGGEGGGSDGGDPMQSGDLGGGDGMAFGGTIPDDDEQKRSNAFLRSLRAA